MNLRNWQRKVNGVVPDSAIVPENKKSNLWLVVGLYFEEIACRSGAQAMRICNSRLRLDGSAHLEVR